MKRFEELYACSVLSVSGFDLFGEYNAWLDEEFLKNGDDFALLEMEELSSNKYKTHSFFRQYFYDNPDFDKNIFGKALFGELERAYHDKNCDFDSFVNNCYAVYQNLPKQIEWDEEPFFALDYAGDSIEWGDYKRAHEIIENAFRFYSGELSVSSNEVKIRAFSEIAALKDGEITFFDGEKVALSSCAGKKWSGRCVGERDFGANPPYFVFFSGEKWTKIIFCKKGLFKKRKNQRDFALIHNFVQSSCFTTMDLQ